MTLPVVHDADNVLVLPGLVNPVAHAAVAVVGQALVMFQLPISREQLVIGLLVQRPRQQGVHHGGEPEEDHGQGERVPERQPPADAQAHDPSRSV